MRYKIISKNKQLIDKAKATFNILNMKEAIHIQEVELYLIDVKSLDKQSINSYKNKISYLHFLFIVNEIQDIKICLENNFKYYINSNFSKEELKLWCKNFVLNPKKNKIALIEDTILNIKESSIIKNNKIINLTPQELLLLLELSKDHYISTSNLAKILKVNSQTTIRTIISRIRKKLEFDIFDLKKGFGYKLKDKKSKKNKKTIPLKKKQELEEQNKFLQNIIDSSPIFIVTFIHQQLYCINKSFRDFLGNETIKELWEKEKGDFFKLITHNPSQYETLKQELFSKNICEIKIFNFIQEKENLFEVKTLYFKKLDKHLLIFKLLK